MNCPKCNKLMRKMRWEISNNYKTGKDFKEYDKYSYQCFDDDIWVTTETPLDEQVNKKPIK